MARQQIVLRVEGPVKSGLKKAAKAAGLSINAYSERVLARSAGVKLAKN
jgi:predicted HicB family RNase H-like nuclease